jgi:hypothetical protein
VSYRTLDATQIVRTIRRLEQRISERFPGAGLAEICHELVSIGEQAQQRSAAIATPNLALRATVYAAIAAGIAGLMLVGLTIKLQVGNAEIFGVFQGVEAAMNITVLSGAALFFLISLEDRIKRRRSLRDLHVFRSIAHVIDMHQLTKYPSVLVADGPSTDSSPERSMNRFELTRYLDYCSEMLSLTSKLAAVYAQNLPDPVIIDAVNDIETLITNLCNKIWQKITILDAGKIEPETLPHDWSARIEPFRPAAIPSQKGSVHQASINPCRTRPMRRCAIEPPGLQAHNMGRSERATCRASFPRAFGKPPSSKAACRPTPAR